LLSLRKVLGAIMSRLNHLSEVVKSGVNAQITPDIIGKAQYLLPDLANLGYMHQILPQVMEKARSLGADNLMLRMIHAIMQAHAADQHLAVVNSVAQGQIPSDEYTEVDVAGAKKFLSSSIYSTGDAQQKTLTVIRELLQNSIDAAVEMKKRNPGGPAPRVDVTTMLRTFPGATEEEKSVKVLDLMVHDNGVGMDWDTLRTKFFRAYSTGKGDYEDATGGYGIAKSVIQETPQHGWSVETGGVHSSSYGKNLYFADKEKYAPPVPMPDMQVSDHGTTVTLFGLPYAGTWEIERMCQRFSLGQAEIYLNNQKIEPTFQYKGRELTNDLSTLIDEVSDNDVEKRAATNVAKKMAPNVKMPNLSNLTWNFEDGTSTTIKFGLVKNSSSIGSVFVMLNGQFQYEDNQWLPKIHILCFVETTTKPGSDGYPLDPGRDNLRKPYSDVVSMVIESVKNLLRKITENSLFSKGLVVKKYNASKQAMTARSVGQKNTDLGDKIRSTLSAPNMTESVYEPEPEGKTENEQREVERTNRIVQQIIPPEISDQLDQVQQSMISSAAGVFRETKDSQEVEKILDAIDTPCAIVFQKDFNKQASVEANPQVVSSLLLLWQTALRRILQKSMAITGEEIDKPLIPGAIFSNEANAVSIPADENNPHIIGVNPLSFAALIEPEMFSKLAGKKDELGNVPKVEGEREGTMSDKVANFLHHAATHEMTHYYYPGSEGFHSGVTLVEAVSHGLYEELKKDVRKYMKPLRKETKQLLRVLRRSKDEATPLKERQVKTEGRVLNDLTPRERKQLWQEKHLRNISYRNLELPEAGFDLRPSNGMTAKRIVALEDFNAGKRAKELYEQGNSLSTIGADIGLSYDHGDLVMKLIEFYDREMAKRRK